MLFAKYTFKIFYVFLQQFYERIYERFEKKNCDCYVNTTKNIFFWRSDFENV